MGFFLRVYFRIWQERNYFIHCSTYQPSLLGVCVCVIVLSYKTLPLADQHVCLLRHPLGMFSALVLSFLIVSHRRASGEEMLHCSPR